MKLTLHQAVIPLAACVLSASPGPIQAAPTPRSVIIACSSPKPCASVKNTGTGRAVDAASVNDSGLTGSTTALNAPFVTVNTLTFGLTGGLAGFDISGSPAIGGGNSGVVGSSIYGYGVSGFTYNNFNYGAGTDVTTFSGLPAILGLDVGPNTGIDGSGNVGIAGRSLTRVGGLFLSRSGYGAVGRSFTGTGVLGVGRAAGAIALAATSLAGGPIFIGNNATHQVATLDSTGSLVLAGGIRTGDTAQFVTHAAGGSSVVTYAGRQTTATVEDFGQAQMHAGYAAVRLDPAFAKIMDASGGYLVFVTPEGESRGIYVAGKTPTGFTLRESGGGRSTLALSYRIVAHAFGMHEARLAAAPSTPVSATAAKRAPSLGAKNLLGEQ